MKCICCNTITEEILETNKECPFYFTKSDMGVKCPHCRNYTCGACIKGFLDRGCNKFVNEDRWSYDMSNFGVGAFFLATLFNVMRVSGTMRKIMLELTKEGI